MGKGRPKKYEKGAAVAYISRNQALRKLQLSLKDFRRLCILKGIYPVEPSNKKKANKGSTVLKTFYRSKDIIFLLHEPTVDKFREQKVYLKRFKRAIGKFDKTTAKLMLESPVTYSLHHIVKERYPSVADALRDLDDALCMVFLYGLLPQRSGVDELPVQLCRRLSYEWMNYVIHTKSLRKAFISIKGYYYQTEVLGEAVTWLVPHRYSYEPPQHIDYHIMSTYTEFYTTMLGFLLYRLYAKENLQYPPRPQGNGFDPCRPQPVGSNDTEKEIYLELVASLNQKLQTVSVPVEDEADITIEGLEESNKLTDLTKSFSKLKFFISREVPREQFVFVLRCLGAEVSWDPLSGGVGSTFHEDDPSVTHQLVDRPELGRHRLNRVYVQPQWVVDCLNAGALLPPHKYFPGGMLPPHLSPFVEEGGYKPTDLVTLLERTDDLKEDDDVSDDVDDSIEDVVEPVKESYKERRNNHKVKEMVADEGKVERVDEAKRDRAEKQAEDKLLVSMLSKRRKRLYTRMMYGKRREVREADVLLKKRDQLKKKHRVV